MDNVEGQLLGEAFSFQWGLKCFCLWNEKFLKMLGDYIPLFIFKQEKISTQILKEIGWPGGFFSRHRLKARHQKRFYAIGPYWWTPPRLRKSLWIGEYPVGTHPPLFDTFPYSRGTDQSKSLSLNSIPLSYFFPVLPFPCTSLTSIPRT